MRGMLGVMLGGKLGEGGWIGKVVTCRLKATYDGEKRVEIGRRRWNDVTLLVDV